MISPALTPMLRASSRDGDAFGNADHALGGLGRGDFGLALLLAGHRAPFLGHAQSAHLALGDEIGRAFFDHALLLDRVARRVWPRRRPAAASHPGRAAAAAPRARNARAVRDAVGAPGRGATGADGRGAGFGRSILPSTWVRAGRRRATAQQAWAEPVRLMVRPAVCGRASPIRRTPEPGRRLHPGRHGPCARRLRTRRLNDGPRKRLRSWTGAGARSGRTASVFARRRA